MDKTLEPHHDRYIVPGLERGLRILSAFTPGTQEMTLSEIARAMNLSRSAAFRAVYTLTEMGFLLSDPLKKSYQLGPAVLKLSYGFMASRELFDIARPRLEQLRDETDWSTHLGVRDGARVLYMLRAPSRMGLGSIVNVGTRLPAVNTTLGRVLLAALDEDTLIQLFDSDLMLLDKHRKPGNFAEVSAQWQADRRKDTVEQLGSFEAGVASVAAPIRDLSGDVVASINATRPSFSDAIIPQDVRNAVLSAAADISALLGYNPD